MNVRDTVDIVLKVIWTIVGIMIIISAFRQGLDGGS